MLSLDTITYLWGTWLAGTYGTRLRFTASFNYAAHEELNPYPAFECHAQVLDLNYDGSSLPTGASNVAHHLWYDNATERAQTEQFEFGSSTQQTFTWSVTTALELGIELSMTAGVPDTLSTSEKVSVKLTLSSTSSESHTAEQEWKVNTEVTVPAQSSVLAQMVIDEQSYDIDWTARVKVTGCTAIWFEDQVSLSVSAGFHNLWFVPIQEMLAQATRAGIDTSGFELQDDGIIGVATGTFTGGQGISVAAQATQHPLRTSGGAAKAGGIPLLFGAVHAGSVAV
ncbi:ETX/MTX2 family pore-forming toxin [Longimicrobium sp.]|uniref:ETX/MTX2 family pore-forming toxin n=1 Tax=Longimicrobium sp. TaxID=2029185 RepID=UPI002E325653|nr:ETX/MTX2 family pore-forming toxin [Longimicrobium sp.]HEX6038477.1 ETX/MTX2 family pore-forming toxin [Longimicrobium sp.]